MLDTDIALTDTDLRAIVRLVYDRSGISLHDGKRALVAARLQKRLRAGGFHTYRDYLVHVEQDHTGQELILLLDAIATNHTSFFRERQHFDLLVERVLPALANGGRPSRLDVWSAGCSTGEEPYTIAMTLLDHLSPQMLPAVRILASDLSTKALRAAQAGVYRLDRVADVPAETLRRHFEKGLGAQAGLARVHGHVRRLIEFQRMNLLDIDDLGRRFAFIFCRNVMIYFDRAVQQRVVSMLERHLAPGGYLFLSHSEGLAGISHGLEWSGPAVYRRRQQ
jgi:chemotaxis protein methyltransferase CheR